MDLQILVPQYNEPDAILKPLLDSLAVQEGFDLNRIGVIICNDGSDVHLSEEFLNSYPFRIDYYLEPHRGVSGTRNACLDHAEADYVMFCDADDKFFNAFGLWIIDTEMQNGFDCLVSKFVEEIIFKNGKSDYVNHENDTTFVHGKVFNRKYLVDNKIRFCDRLTIHEDSFFNILAQRTAHVLRYCQTSFYLWKWRDESVCRRDPKYSMKTFTNLLDSADALISEFYHRGRRDQAVSVVLSSTFDAYYTLNKPEWDEPESAIYKAAAEQRIARFHKKYRKLWDSTKTDDRMRASQDIRGRNIDTGMTMEHVTFDDWMKYIESLTE